MRLHGCAVALTTALVVTVAAPGAHAYGGLGCGVDAVHDHGTSQSAVGPMAGGPFTDIGPVTIWCYLTVNGTLVTSTPAGSGVGSAATAGMAQFAASPSDDVSACTQITVSAGTQVYCYPVVPVVTGTQTYWYLPQPVI